ncbi:class I SAM-dependent methyltransferase, partial [Campylobacter coli]|nr:class I SAM-dependent methyltransferase [Campylobacter coli]
KQDLESYLLENNVKFHKFIFDETRIVERKKDEAIENTLWHLNMNGVKASKQDLETFVKGDIKETIQSKIKLLVF